MNKKRYSIVRVDKDYYLNSCPAGFEEINNDFVCSYKKSKTLNNLSTNCKNCRYGDTKEQLIRKVAQALELCMKKGYRTITLEELAKEIVEFLGVENNEQRR